MPPRINSAGFPCTKCGARTSVTNSRNRGQQIYRRRECACGHRFSTREIEETEHRHLEKVREAVHFVSCAMGQSKH